MLNVAVVGLGWWGRIIVPLLAESRALRVVHTVDANPAAAMAGTPFSTDYGEALRNPAVQGVVLCTPHTLHSGQIVRAASAANISALEAVARSAASGKVEPVSSAVWTTAERVA